MLEGELCEFLGKYGWAWRDVRNVLALPGRLRSTSEIGFLCIDGHHAVPAVSSALHLYERCHRCHSKVGLPPATGSHCWERSYHRAREKSHPGGHSRRHNRQSAHTGLHPSLTLPDHCLRSRFVNTLAGAPAGLAISDTCVRVRTAVSLAHMASSSLLESVAGIQGSGANLVADSVGRRPVSESPVMPRNG